MKAIATLGEFTICKYYESVKPDFAALGLTVEALYSEFKVTTAKGDVVFTCHTVQGLDGFIRGITYAAKANHAA